MPPSISHFCLEGKTEEERVGKYCGNGRGDDEVRVSHLGGEGRVVKFEWIRACVKARLPDNRISNNSGQKRRMEIECSMHFRSWKIVCQCVSATSVSCWIT